MKLTSRERYAAAGAAALVALVAFHQLAVRPAIERIETLERVMPEKTRAMERLRALSAEHRSLQKQLDDVGRAAGQSDAAGMLSQIEQIASDCRLAGNVASMKPGTTRPAGSFTESSLEIRLEGISIKQLVDFLQRVQAAESPAVRSLQVRQSPKTPSLLDADVQLAALAR